MIAPMTDDLAGLVGQHVSVLLAVAGRTVTAKGLLHRETPNTLTLRSLASRTRGRETLLMRQHVVAVQLVEQVEAGVDAPPAVIQRENSEKPLLTTL